MEITLLLIGLLLAFLWLRKVLEVAYTRSYKLPPQAIDLENCLVNFGDPNQIPLWGDPDDWGFDQKLSSWVYYGADEELEARFWKEWEAWMGQSRDEGSNNVGID